MACVRLISAGTKYIYVFHIHIHILPLDLVLILTPLISSAHLHADRGPYYKRTFLLG